MRCWCDYTGGPPAHNASHVWTNLSRSLLLLQVYNYEPVPAAVAEGVASEGEQEPLRAEDVGASASDEATQPLLIPN
jgi:hypothetical protein